MSTLATDAERMDAANEHTADKHATDATAKDLPNAAEPTDSAPSSASKARKPKAAKSRQDNAGSASTAMVPIGNGEQTPMGASAITPATGLAGAAASEKHPSSLPGSTQHTPLARRLGVRAIAVRVALASQLS